MNKLSSTHFTYAPDLSPIELLYQDDELIIVNKASNLLTTPGRGEDKQDCLYSRVLKSFPNARVVHRLDMATSGIVIFALHHQAQVEMGRLFEQRNINKHYIAVVSGKLAQAKGKIDLPLICDWENRPIQKVCHQNGKSAQTVYDLIEYDDQHHRSRVLLAPLTGRSHQLRVHMKALGHPIIGDAFYHPDYKNTHQERLLLHASLIEFTHPFSLKPIKISSAPPF